MSKRVIVPLFGDTHFGSVWGLLNPETKLLRQGLTGEYTTEQVSLTEIQRFLWEFYTDSIAEIMRWAGSDEVIPMHMGDLSNGKKYPEGLVSTRTSDQFTMSVYGLSEWFKYPNVSKMRIIEGTPSHGFGETSTEDVVSQLLISQYPQIDFKLEYYGLININNVVFDLTHHGPTAGKRIWLKGNELRYYIRSIVTNELMQGRKAPDVIGRAHVHEPVEEWIVVNNKRTLGLITPPLCFPNEFAKQITAGVYLVTVGMVAIETITYDNGMITFFPHWFKKTIDIRTKEIL